MNFFISITWVYILAAVLPILILPLLLPKVALMARRKNITDKPNERKLQRVPVMVTGGTVIISVLCSVLLILNVFYRLDPLFSSLCVMFIMYIFGLLDDTIGLTYQFKFVGQIICVSLLFLCGGFQIVIPIPAHGWAMLVSYVVSLFVGLLLINAYNFIDGIDGLASAIGIMLAGVFSWWNIRHGLVTDALLSLSIASALLGFFFFNVFSSKYKMYLGDSGSLVLGIAAYIPVCVSSTRFYATPIDLEVYEPGFFFAVFSVMVFDLARVVFVRLSMHKSPFLPDRNHLHHVLVDVGLTHHVATLLILSLNLLVLLVWYLTAQTGMNEWLQLALVVVTAVIIIWTPYFWLTYLRTKRPRKYVRLRTNMDRWMHFDRMYKSFMQRVVDNGFIDMIWRSR